MVSVIMPVYNVEKYLREAISSVIGQSYQEWELILVDDGSTDRSASICDQYAKADKRIKVIHQKNGGLSAARNTGIKSSSGEYLLFLDSDDYVAQNALSELVMKAENENSDIVLFEMSQVNDETGEIIKYSTYTINACNNLLQLLDSDNYYAMACGYLIKRRVIIEGNISFYEGILHEDELFTMQVMLKCRKISIVAKTDYFYRIRSNSIIKSNKNLSGKGNSLLFIIMKMASWYPEYEKNSDYQKAIDIRMEHLFQRAMADYFEGSPIVQFKMLENMHKCTQIVSCLDREWSKGEDVQYVCKKYVIIGAKTYIKKMILKGKQD